MNSSSFRLSVLIAIVLISIFTVGSVFGIIVYGTQNSTPIVLTIFGFSSTIITSLFILLGVGKNQQMQEEHNKKAEDRTHKIEQSAATIEHAARTIDQDIHKIQSVKIDLTTVALPTTREELQTIVTQAINQSCGALQEFLADTGREMHKIKHLMVSMEQAAMGKDVIIETLDADVKRLTAQLAKYEK